LQARQIFQNVLVVGTVGSIVQIQGLQPCRQGVSWHTR
jgi:hypothetical protein